MDTINLRTVVQNFLNGVAIAVMTAVIVAVVVDKIYFIQDYFI